jgi:hypothetical protein
MTISRLVLACVLVVGAIAIPLARPARAEPRVLLRYLTSTNARSSAVNFEIGSAVMSSSAFYACYSPDTVDTTDSPDDTVTLTLNAKGHPSKVKAASSDRDRKRCLQRAGYRLAFPAVGARVKVTIQLRASVVEL